MADPAARFCSSMIVATPGALEAIRRPGAAPGPPCVTSAAILVSWTRTMSTSRYTYFKWSTIPTAADE